MPNMTEHAMRVTPDGLRIRMSLNFPALPLSQVSELAQQAEAAGFTALRLGDMQSTTRELYCVLTMIGASTSTVGFGPGVTNPVTRDPAVTASAMATLQEFSGGRAVLGIGTGDSAVHNVGGRPATLAELEEFVVTVRALHLTGSADYNGRKLILNWWTGGAVPIILSAHGPKMLRLAGRVADGVVVGIGTGPLAREYADEQIAAGASEAGRDPEDIERWYLTYLNIAGDSSTAARQVGSALAVGGNLLARSSARSIIPNRLRAGFAELAARYSYTHHAGGSDDNPNALLLDELGLRDHLAEEFGVLGTPEEITLRLDSLASQGVTSHWSAYVPTDLGRFLARWKSEVVAPADSQAKVVVTRASAR